MTVSVLVPIFQTPRPWGRATTVVVEDKRINFRPHARGVETTVSQRAFFIPLHMGMCQVVFGYLTKI